MSGRSGATVAVPPGTEGAWRNVILGLACAVVGVVLLIWAGLDAPAAVIAIGALLCIAGLFVANAGRQRLRARRVGTAANQCSWAGVCFRSNNRYMLRAFVVDIDGVHLSTLGGRRLADWAWPALANALVMPIAVGSRQPTGLTLDTRDGSPSPSFLFPPSIGFGVSQTAAERATAAVRARLQPR